WTVSYRECNARKFSGCVLQLSVLAAGDLATAQVLADDQSRVNAGYEGEEKVSVIMPNGEVIKAVPVNGDAVTVGPDTPF
ncbi:autotransporter outer membrane beta-barrel domain-containing protein, partial [Pseudomonas syringae pv. tagetis]